ALESAPERFPCGNDLRDDAEGEGFGRVEAPAQEHQLFRLPGPDQADEPVGASGAREDAELDLGQSDSRGLVGDAQVGCGGALEPAAETPAADGRDRRHRQCGDALVDVAGVRVVSGDGSCVRLGELVDVRAGGERLPGSRDHDAVAAAHILSAERVEKLAFHGTGERIQLLLALQRDHADVFLAADVDEAHPRTPSRTAASSAPKRSISAGGPTVTRIQPSSPNSLPGLTRNPGTTSSPVSDASSPPTSTSRKLASDGSDSIPASARSRAR